METSRDEGSNSYYSLILYWRDAKNFSVIASKSSKLQNKGV